MKKHLIFCIALVAVMASCVKEPKIYRRLTDEEAAAVPYRMGESIKMLDQDGDTLCLTVVRDTTYVTYNYYDSHYNPYAKTSILPQPYFYMREVVLQGSPEDSCLLRCNVAPEKVVSISYEKYVLSNNYDGDFFYWRSFLYHTLRLGELPTTTFSLGEVDYENVYVVEGSYMSDTATISYAWYYSEEYGLLAAKDGNHSLARIP